MPPNDKRQTKKTVTISLDSYNVLKSIAESVTPNLRLEDAVALLVKMYLEAPDIPNENVEAFETAMKPVVERFVHNAPIEEREVLEELLEPEVTLVEQPVIDKPQKVYTGLMAKFMRKEGQPIVSKHTVKVIQHEDE